MYAVHTAVIRGAQALPVTVEVSMSAGIPGMSLVGMPDSAVHDAPPRVRSAMKSCGFELPRLHVTVNLAPGELRKTGTGFDLPIAVATLAATGQIPCDGLDRTLFVGELGLDGSVCPVRGSIAYALLAKEQGLDLASAPVGRLPDGLDCTQHPLLSLSQLRAGISDIVAAPGEWRDMPAASMPQDSLDFVDVIDQEIAKRAFTIAAAGRHGLLMVGPPGSGKTMLARRMPSILPPMSEEEQLESLLVHSVANDPRALEGFGTRPFRSPHHSISMAGMVGGGRPVMPGEVSLAHCGVLFLDELPEFAPGVLQGLRQPMEDKVVNITRVDGTYRFPCDFQLVAAANPCPCGYLGDPGHECRCSAAIIDRYQGRIGGPLMNRIDIVVNVARPNEQRVISGERGMSSQEMREAVESAREFAVWRTRKDRREGGEKESRGAVQAARLDNKARSVLESIAHRKAFGGRSIARVARVARTIADVERHELVTSDDVIEACSYRSTFAGQG